MSIKAEFRGDTPYYFVTAPVIAHNDGGAASLIGEIGTDKPVGTINVGSFEDGGGYAMIGNLSERESVTLDAGQEALSNLFIGLIVTGF